MTDVAGFCEGCGMPVCCDQLRVMVDAARAYEVAFHAGDVHARETAGARIAYAVRALDGGE